MSNLMHHAAKELKLLGMTEDSSDEMTSGMTKDILELIEVFSKQGHSGFSAEYCISVFSKLARYEALSDLTGDDDEWNDVGSVDGNTLFQNNRASNVFKEVTQDGDLVKSYQIDRYVFREPDGATYTRGGEFGSIYLINEWPYSPTHEFIDVPFQEEQLALNFVDKQ